MPAWRDRAQASTAGTMPGSQSTGTRTASVVWLPPSLSTVRVTAGVTVFSAPCASYVQYETSRASCALFRCPLSCYPVLQNRLVRMWLQKCRFSSILGGSPYGVFKSHLMTRTVESIYNATYIEGSVRRRVSRPWTNSTAPFFCRPAWPVPAHICTAFGPPAAPRCTTRSSATSL